MASGNYSRGHTRRELFRRGVAVIGSLGIANLLPGCGISVSKKVIGGEDPNVPPTQPPIPYVPQSVEPMPLDQIVDNPPLFEVNGGSILQDQDLAFWGYPVPLTLSQDGVNGDARLQVRNFNADTHRVVVYGRRLLLPQNTEVLDLLQQGLPLTFIGKYLNGSEPVIIGGRRVGGTIDLYALKPLLMDPLDDPNYEANLLTGLTTVDRS